MSDMMSNSNKLSSIEDNEFILKKLADEYKQEIDKRDICDASTYLNFAYLYKSKDRDFGLIAGIPGLRPRYLDVMITFSENKDIDSLCKLGFNFLKYIYDHGKDLNLANLYIEDVIKEFTEFNKITIEKYLIQKKLSIRKNYNKEEINNLYDAGLRLNMLKNKKIINQIVNSENHTATIHGIINRYQHKKENETYDKIIFKIEKKINLLIKFIKEIKNDEFLLSEIGRSIFENLNVNVNDLFNLSCRKKSENIDELLKLF